MNTPQRTQQTQQTQQTTEASIDRALASLRHAQPREGLERRILHALESREAHTASPRSLHTPRQLFPSLPLAACIAAGALALLTVAALHLLNTHPRPQTLALATPAPTPTPAASSPQRAGWPILSRSSRKGGVAMPASTIALSSRLTPNLPTRLTSTLSSRPKAALFAAAAERPAGRIAASTTTPQQLTPEESADLADLHAPSHPAPPLPLTAQEKALLTLLHRGNAVELADLIPAVSAAHDAEEAAAFHTFFPDPPPIQQPTGDTE